MQAGLRAPVLYLVSCLGIAEAETGTESQAAASYIPLFLSNAALALYIAVFPKEVTHLTV